MKYPEPKCYKCPHVRHYGICRLCAPNGLICDVDSAEAHVAIKINDLIDRYQEQLPSEDQMAMIRLPSFQDLVDVLELVKEVLGNQ